MDFQKEGVTRISQFLYLFSNQDDVMILPDKLFNIYSYVL